VHRSVSLGVHRDTECSPSRVTELRGLLRFAFERARRDGRRPRGRFFVGVVDILTIVLDLRLDQN
jgi:hypothetical protein